jgi:two-component system, cell cycle sensor histidine kinase and response regulator CckA
MEIPKNKDPRIVLLVDNFEPVLEVTEGYLESEGFSVLTAAGGIDALRVAQQYSGTIDLLLTEEQLPGMNGAALVARLKLLRPSLAVIVMSAAIQGKTYAEYEAQHGALFLWKPFTKTELIDRVSLALQGKQTSPTSTRSQEEIGPAASLL